MSYAQLKLMWRVANHDTQKAAIDEFATDDEANSVADPFGNTPAEVLFPSGAAPSIGTVFCSSDQKLIIVCGPLISAVWDVEPEPFYTFTVFYEVASFTNTWTAAAAYNEHPFGNSATDLNLRIFGS